MNSQKVPQSGPAPVVSPVSAPVLASVLASVSAPVSVPDATLVTAPAQLRAATPADVPAILGLIRELAVFEKLEHLMVVTPQDLQQHLFGERPSAEAVVAQCGDEVVAFALFFTNFSTFLGRPGLYLEDLYVQPAQRSKGIGKALLQHLGALAVARNYGRFEWCVLDWNAPAIAFYKKMGASVMTEWQLCRVTGPALTHFSGDAP